MSTKTYSPGTHVLTAFTNSAVTHTNHVGVNPAELDALSQVISRLSQDKSMAALSLVGRKLHELEELGHVEISTIRAGTLVVTTCAPG